MILNRDSLLCFGLIFMIPFLLELAQKPPAHSSENRGPANKELKDLFSRMIYIEGDTFTMGLISSEITMTPSDSTLIANGIPKRAIVDPYYISATEVTNGNWREFYQAKVLELGESAGKRNFYPDTSLWHNEFPYSYNAPLAKNYFTHPNFNDYPVVGITWDQANAYCQWKSKKLETLLKKVGIEHSPTFRLPTEAEWEYAAIKVEDAKYSSQSTYVWSEKNQMGQINDVVNIGQIRDINNVVLKQYAEDGCLYTCKVASYPPNVNDIYDMAGNVSEWTSDQGSLMVFGLENREYKTLYNLSEIDREIEVIEADSDVLDSEIRKLLLKSLEQNRKIFSSGDIKICKGGSWANGMVYTQPGSRQGVKKDNASTKIGFRLAISDVSKDVLEYFPDKNWKPSSKKKGR